VRLESLEGQKKSVPRKSGNVFPAEMVGTEVQFGLRKKGGRSASRVLPAKVRADF